MKQLLPAIFIAIFLGGCSATPEAEVPFHPTDSAALSNQGGKGETGDGSEVERLAAAPRINLWPVPDSDYTFVYYRMRRVEDAGSGVETADMNFRFLPCLVAGLAYHIAMKVPEFVDRITMLKTAYDEQYNLAAGEDREKTSEHFVPRVSRI